MNTQFECLDALAQGHTLTNGVTFVYLDKLGYQIIVHPNDNHPQAYTFDAPDYWTIVPKPATPDINTSYLILFFIFLIPIVIAFMYITYNNETTQLQNAYNQLLHDNNDLTTELNSYHATEQELIELGASSSQAKDIIKSSELYDIDPKH